MNIKLAAEKSLAGGFVKALAVIKIQPLYHNYSFCIHKNHLANEVV